MKPNQTATKLSLNKTVVTALTNQGMMNYHGAAANTGEGVTKDPPPPPHTWDTCFTCNSLVPEGCGTGTGIASW